MQINVRLMTRSRKKAGQEYTVGSMSASTPSNSAKKYVDIENLINFLDAIQKPLRKEKDS